MLIGMPCDPGGAVHAGDWPQILGPHRSGVAVDEKPIPKLPQVGPRQRWQYPVGQGFAGVAVVGDQVILFHRMGDQEIVESLDARTGKSQWRRSFPTAYVCTYASDSGPRCVPTVAGERIVVFGAGGLLACLNRKDGREIWSHDTRKDFAAVEGFFGAGSSPVVDSGRVIVNLGGRKDFGVVAFSLQDGAVLWSVKGEAASYAAPIVARIAGAKTVLCVTRFNFLGLDPASGEKRFAIPFGKRGPTVNGASPVLVGDHVLLSASYGIGARWIGFTAGSADVVWDRQDMLSSQYSTCVQRDGILFGIDGREDIPPANLRAIDPEGPTMLWEQPGFGMATIIRVNDQLVIMKTDGTLVLAAADRAAYREIGRAKLCDSLTRALPAYARGCLYVRDTQSLRCYELAETR